MLSCRGRHLQVTRVTTTQGACALPVADRDSGHEGAVCLGRGAGGRGEKPALFLGGTWPVQAAVLSPPAASPISPGASPRPRSPRPRSPARTMLLLPQSAAPPPHKCLQPAEWVSHRCHWACIDTPPLPAPRGCAAGRGVLHAESPAGGWPEGQRSGEFEFEELGLTREGRRGLWGHWTEQKKCGDTNGGRRGRWKLLTWV